MNPAEDCWELEVASRHFSIANVDLVDIVDMVDNIYTINTHTSFGNL